MNYYKGNYVSLETFIIVMITGKGFLLRKLKVYPGLNELQERKVCPSACPSMVPLHRSTREKLLLTAPISGCVWDSKWEPKREVIELGNAFTSFQVPSAVPSCEGALPVTGWVQSTAMGKVNGMFCLLWGGSWLLWGENGSQGRTL